MEDVIIASLVAPDLHYKRPYSQRKVTLVQGCSDPVTGQGTSNDGGDPLYVACLLPRRSFTAIPNAIWTIERLLTSGCCLLAAVPLHGQNISSTSHNSDVQLKEHESDITSAATDGNIPDRPSSSTSFLSAESKPALNGENGKSKPSFSDTDPNEDKYSRDIEKVELENGTPKQQVETKDPNIVDWDGPDDPMKAVNWPKKKKWGTIGCLSAMTFITPLASSMFAPGVPQVLSDFSSDDALLGSFVVSVYILGYATGPLIVAPLSELYGRRWVYHSTNVLFVIFTVACAVASNLNMLIGFRFLAGCAGSAVLTMGGGTVADLFRQEERGSAIALFSAGPLVGPVVGPVAGGFLSQAKGWRWVFWVIAMFAGALTILCFCVLSESYPTTILEQKAKKLRKETGNQSLRSLLHSGLTPFNLFKRSIIRPAKMLFFSPIVLLLSIDMAVVYGYLYLLFTTITEVFQSRYHFSQGSVGLTYLGLGIGMFLGLAIFGAASDYILKRQSAKGEMKPEYRLPPMIPGAFFIPIGLFIYGWTAEKQVFWFVPIFGSSLVGLGLLATFLPIQTYLVDAFTIHAASALAANTVLRSLAGALLPLAGPTMYAKLGLGWGNSLLGFIAVAMLPIPWFFLMYGERIRTSPRFRVTF
ncbi:hypothetical protein MMC34_000395 [Xylographa carneopallida]|nr:hypothetical protein [Xylographa carneopallida]